MAFKSCYRIQIPMNFERSWHALQSDIGKKGLIKF